MSLRIGDRLSNRYNIRGKYTMLYKKFLSLFLLFALFTASAVLSGCNAPSSFSADDLPKSGYSPEIEYMFSDGFPVQNLTAGSTAEYPEKITIPSASSLDYSINYSPMGIHLTICLRAENGTEYRAETVGGTGEGTFSDLPEGNYSLILEHANIDSRTLENAVLVFGIR